MKLVKVNVMYVDVDAVVSDIIKSCKVLSSIASNEVDSNLSGDIVGTLCAMNDNITEITNKIINK